MRFSVWELLLILVIVLVLFGGTRLRNLGSDLGSAIRGFRDSMKDGAKSETAEENPKKIEQAATQDHENGSATTTTLESAANLSNKVG